MRNLHEDGGAAMNITVIPGGSPVFDLPDGFTANSADGLIVDNMFVKPLQTNAVPEPSSLVLLGMGTLGLTGLGCQRRRKAR